MTIQKAAARNTRFYGSLEEKRDTCPKKNKRENVSDAASYNSFMCCYEVVLFSRAPQSFKCNISFIV